MISRYKTLLFFLALATLLFGGCSFNSVSVKSGEFCVYEDTKISDLVAGLNKATQQSYSFDGSDCDDYVVPFIQKRCFSNISELDFYIQDRTDFFVDLNTLHDNGIKVVNLHILEAIDYFNSRGGDKEILYYDENLVLKNNPNIRFKNMAELKRYVSDTTPFFFSKIYDSPERVTYTLKYKKIHENTVGKEAVVMNLKKAKELTMKTAYKLEKKRILANRIDLTMSGVENYEENE